MQALSLSFMLASPAALALPGSSPNTAVQSAQALQGAWQQARQHFPALQVLESSWPAAMMSYDAPENPGFLRVSQTDQQALQAFDSSKYSYWDARVLADFWKMSVGDTKVTMGRKLLWGGANRTVLENCLADARTQALASQGDLHIFQESGFSFDDAARLATFWGEPNPFEAKLRLERKLIFGNERALRDDLRQAQKPQAPQVQQDFLGDLPGSRWNYNYRGQTFQFDFGQTNIENFSNGWWPGVSWQPSGPNQLRLWDSHNKRAMKLLFDSPTSFTGHDWDGSAIWGSRVVVNSGANPNAVMGQITQLQPTPSQMTGDSRPDFRARFSSPPDPRTVRFVVDRMDHSRGVFFSKSGDVLIWKPKRDLAPGTHVAEISAVGSNQESFSARWTFSTPGYVPTLPPPTGLRVDNVQAGELLGSRFTIRGVGVPGSGVVVRVEYPKQDILSQLSGVMLRFQAEGKVAADGTFSITMDAGEVPRGEKMNITVSDSANSPLVTLRAEKGAHNQVQRSP